MSMIQLIGEFPDIQLWNPPTTILHRLLPQGIQRIVRRSSRMETIRAVTEILLLNGLQDHDDRPLKHLVFKRRDSDRARLSAIRCCRVDTISKSDVSVMFPSNGSVT